MPSREPLPTIRQFLDAYHTGMSLGDPDADRHVGSIYEDIGGPAALLWRRLVERTRAGFRENYQAHASRRLDQHMERRYDREREQGSPGTGTIVARRPNTVLGAGFFRKGTRFLVGKSGEKSTYYEVTADTLAVDTATEVTIEVAATYNGPFGAVEGGTELFMAWTDPIWDQSWVIEEINVGPGTLREGDDEYRQSARSLRFDDRPGHTTKIESMLRTLGAQTVVLMGSEHFGDDDDLGNFAVVGDAGFETSAELLKACRLALDGVTIAGTAVQAVPLTRVVLEVVVTIHLFDEPARFDTVGIAQAARGAVLEYFESRTNAFLWTANAIRSAVYRSTRNIQSLSVTTSVAEPSLSALFADPPLPRFVATPYSVNVVILGPE